MRFNVMKNMLEKNIGIITARSNKSSNMDHFFISNVVMETKCGERTTQSAIFPLYIYPDTQKENLFNYNKREKEPNISPDIFEKLKKLYRRSPSPEEILYYIYGVFYSNIYRETYAEFLKIDFPRVPFTADENLFQEIGDLGEQLADLHLLKSPLLDVPIARYQGPGDNDRIDRIDYKENEQRIYINNDKYFEGISPKVWNYHIGGYQVLAKYLKDRKGRILEDAPHYCRIATALQKTIEIQTHIDSLYPGIEKKLIDF
jgi:predicted helicase